MRSEVEGYRPFELLKSLRDSSHSLQTSGRYRLRLFRGRMEDHWPLRKVMSGGQTGADRAGLEVAKRLGYETGGTVPRGYKTSKGPDPTLKQFGVVEHSSDRYPPRTVKNARDADGTVWFGNEETSGGKLTIGTVQRLRKPLLINPTAVELRAWVIDHNISVLNVAGDRETNSPGIQARVEEILAQALAR